MLRSGITSFQWFSYVISIIMMPMTGVAYYPIFTPYCSIAVFVVYIMIYILVAYLTITDSCISELKTKTKSEGFVRKEFQSAVGRHVIENGHCNVCDADVKKDTKHCKRCNYCVEKFDHHCIWLNNCIGAVNYRKFLFLVSSITLTSLISLASFSFIIVTWFSPSNTLKVDLDIYSDTFRILWLFTCIICVVVYFVIFLTTTHLLFFHFRLLKMGLTTYKFIVKQRKNKVAGMGTISTVSRTNTNSHNGGNQHRNTPVMQENLC